MQIFEDFVLKYSLMAVSHIIFYHLILEKMMKTVKPISLITAVLFSSTAMANVVTDVGTAVADGAKTVGTTIVDGGKTVLLL